MELEDTPFFLPFWLRGKGLFEASAMQAVKKGLMDMLVRELKEEL